ncbi:hypothetical protein [Mesorhizobium sp. ISC11]|uniref:hypothetical protein n=1 Tax=Mesorhizobium sp. ISC11 TaxID=3076428 RepID=UPI00301CF5A1
MTNTKITMLTAVLLLGSFMGATQAATLKAAPVKPSSPGVIAAPSGGATEDHYCKNGHAKFANCSADFVAACKKVGGTMSDVQGWVGVLASRPPDTVSGQAAPSAPGFAWMSPGKPRFGGVFCVLIARW